MKKCIKFHLNSISNPLFFTLRYYNIYMLSENYKKRQQKKKTEKRVEF